MDYVVTEEVIGKGTYSVVKKILIDGKPYAGKFMHGKIDKEKNIARFQSSNHIIECKQIVVLQGRECIIMDLYEGPLYQLIQNDSLYPSCEQMVSILFQTAFALAEVHKQGYIHLDLKFDNLLYKRVGKQIIVKLTDFGLSTKWNQKKSSIGTVEYKSPEHFNKQEIITTKTDIWSYGIMVFASIFRRFPYKSFPYENIEQHISFKLHRYSIDPAYQLLLRLIRDTVQMDPKKRPTAPRIMASQVFKHLVEMKLTLQGKYLRIDVIAEGKQFLVLQSKSDIKDLCQVQQLIQLLLQIIINNHGQSSQIAANIVRKYAYYFHDANQLANQIKSEFNGMKFIRDDLQTLLDARRNKLRYFIKKVELSESDYYQWANRKSRDQAQMSLQQFYSQHKKKQLEHACYFFRKINPINVKKAIQQLQIIKKGIYQMKEKTQ